MNVNIPLHRVDVRQAVNTWFTAGQPEDARQNPVSLRVLPGQFRRIYLPGRPPADENGIDRTIAPDFCPHNVSPAWSLMAALPAPDPFFCRGNRIRRQRRTGIIPHNKQLIGYGNIYEHVCFFASRRWRKKSRNKAAASMSRIPSDTAV